MELLVAVAIFAVIVGLAARPTADILSTLYRTSKKTEAMTRNLLFLEMLAQDVRAAEQVVEVSNSRISLSGPSWPEPITWEITGTSATRTEDNVKTVLPISVFDLVLAPDATPPGTRHLILRGNFEGLGVLSKGMGLRLAGVAGQ